MLQHTFGTVFKTTVLDAVNRCPTTLTVMSFTADTVVPEPFFGQTLNHEEPDSNTEGVRHPSSSSKKNTSLFGA